MNTREMTDKLQDWQERAGETARTVGKAMHKHVHENAWTSIAFAAVIGCIVGFLLANRRD